MRAANLGACERLVATTATRRAREAGAGHDLVADLARGRHVDRTREALERKYVMKEVAVHERPADELNRMVDY